MEKLRADRIANCPHKPESIHTTRVNLSHGREEVRRACLDCLEVFRTIETPGVQNAG